MTRRTTLVLAALIALFLTAGFLRLNDRSLYSDSTRYLIWGNSIASGNGFLDGTRPNPSRFVMNAPLYAVLLAPVEFFFPLSITAAKVWTLLWAAGALLLLFLWLRRHIGIPSSFAATSFLAFNALFLVTSTEILSEAPFLCFSIAILWMMERFLEQEIAENPPVLLVALIAVLPLLREVGLALALSTLFVLFREKRGKAFLTIAIPAALLFLGWTVRNLAVGSHEPGEASNLQFVFGRFVTGPDDSILAELDTRFWTNLKGYGWTIGSSLFHPSPQDLIVSPSSVHSILQTLLEGAKPVLTVAGGAMIVHGIVLDRPPSPPGLLRSLALLMYLVIILLYPVHDIRFLVPLLPLLLYYASRSLAALISRLPGGMPRTSAGVALSALLLIPNLSASIEVVRSNMAYRADSEGFSKSSDDAEWFGQPWSLLGEWINRNTPEDAVIASPAKDLAVFVHPRKVLEASRALPTPILERLLRDYEAKYLVSAAMWNGLETFEIALHESNRIWLEPLHQVADLRISRIHSALLEPRPSARPLPDTTIAEGKILAGRAALHKLDYDRALELFGAAARQEPNEPEPVFQVMAVLSIAGDSAGAMEMNKRLFTLPKSTAYSQLAQAMIGAMLQLRKAERESGVQRGYTAFEAGLAYWTLGYRATGLAVMRNIAQADTSHFSAALWGCYYAKQLGDTAESYEFLKRLRKIDITAPIVADWETMRTLELQIRTARSPEARAALHAKIAQVYTKIELFDEALDALERAENLMPDDPSILLARAHIFERKKAIWGAKGTYERILRIDPENGEALEGLKQLGE